MLDWMQPALRPVPGLPFIRTGVELGGSHFEHHRMSTIRKTSLWLCLSGLGLFVVTTRASASEVDIGFHANCIGGGVKATLGPWFTYFPYDAYFQMPAPIAPYPNWPVPFPAPPPPMMPPASGFQAPPPMAAPPVQPVGYGYPMPYWYGYGYGGYSGR
jgi:hypothetical protein